MIRPDTARCYVCGGEFSTKLTIIEGRAAHEGCAVMSYPPHTADAMAKMHDALQTEIERLQANQERMWCKACGTVTRDRQCDCTKFSDQDTQSLVNYADAMQKSVHEEAQENELLRAALKDAREALAILDHNHRSGLTVIRGGIPIGQIIDAALAGEQSAPEKQEG